MPALVRQLFEARSCTYTYLLADPDTGDASCAGEARARREEEGDWALGAPGGGRGVGGGRAGGWYPA